MIVREELVRLILDKSMLLVNTNRTIREKAEDITDIVIKYLDDEQKKGARNNN